MYSSIKIEDFLTVMFFSLVLIPLMFKIISIVGKKTVHEDFFVSNWPDEVIRTIAIIGFFGFIGSVFYSWYNYPKLYIPFAIAIVFFTFIFWKFFKLMKE